jgi:glycosyltransferase involved in cell wall biosynthesis
MNNLTITFINYYIDKERSPHGSCKNYTTPIICAKFFKNVYIYQGIKGTKNIKDGKICKINADGTNEIIDGDPNNKYQTPGNHNLMDYPDPSSKFSKILLNSDLILILDKPAHLFSELNKTNAFIVQIVVYSPPLPYANKVVKSDDLIKINGSDFSNIAKKYENINRINNYDIGLIGSICTRKGQLSFLDKINNEKVKNYTFHLVGPILEKNYYNEIISTLKKKNLKYKIHGELKNEEYIKILCNLKCIVHYSKKDANPRVIMDAIHCGTPYFASEKCEIPTILHKFGIINNNINEFYKLLNFNNHKEIIEFVKNELNNEKYIYNFFSELIKLHL